MTTFDAERCREALDTERYGRSLTALSATESTMDDARAAAEQGAPDGHVVVADIVRDDVAEPLDARGLAERGGDAVVEPREARDVDLVDAGELHLGELLAGRRL